MSELDLKLYLVKLRTDATVGDFTLVGLAEHREIVVVGESSDVCTRDALSDRLVFEMHRLHR